MEKSVNFIQLGSLPERPYPILPLIGEGMSKIAGKINFPKFYSFPLLIRRGLGRGRVGEKNNLPNRIIFMIKSI
jgi:hypothetical protein